MSSLAPCAVDFRHSRGRRHIEAPPTWRSEFQRDRDRILHCSAFRRLEYKTQVFVNHEGDMFRTRLTHTLEVAQIARTVARALDLNEDLTEAIALAHDLGHTPFGHAGQKALDRCMRPWGGFEHNLQSLRVVDVLEQRYPAFAGLNLLFETREGILKHCRFAHAHALGDVGERFLRRQRPSLEAQIANVADEIAYNHHDIDDGLRSGILGLDVLEQHSVFRDSLATTRGSWPALDRQRLLHTAIRSMLGVFVNDLIASTRQRLARTMPPDVQAVREHPAPLVDFSTAVHAEHVTLKRLLRRHLYEDSRVRRFAARAARVVSELFAAFAADPARMPPEQFDPRRDAATDLPRAIADYIAGMTDRYAIGEHRRLCGGVPPLDTRLDDSCEDEKAGAIDDIDD